MVIVACKHSCQQITFSYRVLRATFGIEVEVCNIENYLGTTTETTISQCLQTLITSHSALTHNAQQGYKQIHLLLPRRGEKFSTAGGSTPI